MAILRVNKTKDYTTMSNYHFKDKRLSLKAKGLLSEMLSLPENWDYSIAGLVAINKEEETAIKSTLDELKQFNYLVITKLMPNETDSGRYEYVYDIYEAPKKQEGDFLGVEILGLENQGQYNTNNKINNNKEEISKEESIYDYYQNKIGILNPNQYEMFNSLIDEVGEDKVKKAIDTTVSYGGNTLGYVIKVAKGNNRPPKNEASIPEWINKEMESEEMSPEELAELQKGMDEIFK